jgi:hypothetical protein
MVALFVKVIYHRVAGVSHLKPLVEVLLASLKVKLKLHVEGGHAEPQIARRYEGKDVQQQVG